MLDLLEILFTGIGETICGIVDFFLGWRFWVCVAAAVILIGLTYATFDSEKLSLAVSIPVGVILFTTGLIWDYRNG